MSKKNKEPMIGWGPGWIVGEYKIPHIEGELLTIIETIGLPKTQEEAVKSLVRRQVWSIINDTQRVNGETHTKIRQEYQGQCVPAGSPRNS